MANLCFDDVYFYSNTNKKGLNELWEDLEHTIIFCNDVKKADISNLFRYKKIETSGLYLRGSVNHLRRSKQGILLTMDSCWHPLYDAYKKIAETYRVSFVMESIEPNGNVFYNTDMTGDFFRDKFYISFPDEDIAGPSGLLLNDVMDPGSVFETEDVLLQKFAILGYKADSIDELKELLADTDICIHEFCNPYLNVSAQ